MQLSLLTPTTTANIDIHTTADRHTISRDGLWWTGIDWSPDESRAIGLHGDGILRSEIERYFSEDSE